MEEFEINVSNELNKNSRENLSSKKFSLLTWFFGFLVSCFFCFFFNFSMYKIVFDKKKQKKNNRRIHRNKTSFDKT